MSTTLRSLHVNIIFPIVQDPTIRIVGTTLFRTFSGSFEFKLHECESELNTKCFWNIYFIVPSNIFLPHGRIFLNMFSFRIFWCQLLRKLKSNDMSSKQKISWRLFSFLPRVISLHDLKPTRARNNYYWNGRHPG